MLRRISTSSLLRDSRNSIASPSAPAAAENLRTSFGASNQFQFYCVKNFFSTGSVPNIFTLPKALLRTQRLQLGACAAVYSKERQWGERSFVTLESHSILYDKREPVPRLYEMFTMSKRLLSSNAGINSDQEEDDFSELENSKSGQETSSHVDEGNLSSDEKEEEQELELSLTETKDTRKTVAASSVSSHKIANIAAIVGHGVVDIHVSPEYYGEGKSSYASGFSIDNEGTILTCAHAVINTDLPVTKSYVKQVRARITFKDKRVFYGIVGKYDINRDVAIVRLLPQKTEKPFPRIKLGESSTIRTRNRIIAFGSPVSLPKNISVGIVSSTDHTNIIIRYPHFCATNTGCSGGPLISLDGRVVGISLWATKYSVPGFSSLNMNVAGLGFGIQIDLVKNFIHNYYARRRRSKSLKKVMHDSANHL